MPAHDIYGGISEQMARSTLYVPLILRGTGYCLRASVRSCAKHCPRPPRFGRPVPYR